MISYFLCNFEKLNSCVKTALATFGQLLENFGLLFTPTSGHTAVVTQKSGAWCKQLKCLQIILRLSLSVWHLSVNCRRLCSNIRQVRLWSLEGCLLRPRIGLRWADSRMQLAGFADWRARMWSVKKARRIHLSNIIGSGANIKPFKPILLWYTLSQCYVNIILPFMSIFRQIWSHWKKCFKILKWKFPIKHQTAQLISHPNGNSSFMS